MPRPKKCRKICGLPKRCNLGPLDGDALQMKTLL